MPGAVNMICSNDQFKISSFLIYIYSNDGRCRWHSQNDANTIIIFADENWAYYNVEESPILKAEMSDGKLTKGFMCIWNEVKSNLLSTLFYYSLLHIKNVLRFCCDFILFRTVALSKVLNLLLLLNINEAQITRISKVTQMGV